MLGIAGFVLLGVWFYLVGFIGLSIAFKLTKNRSL